MMVNRRAEFTAKHLRPPTADEEREIAERERQDRREADAARHERDLRRAYLETPGATREQWEKEKGEILKKDREAQALTREDRARASQAALYRNF